MNNDQFDPINNLKEEIHIVQDEKKQQEYTFIGSMIMHKGSKVWSFNRKTHEFKPVQLKTEVDQVIQNKQVLTFMDILHKRPIESSFHHRADFNPDCIYVIAINAKNAAKKINKYLPPETQILVKKDYATNKRS